APTSSGRVAGWRARLPSVAVRPSLKPSRPEACMPRSTGRGPSRSTRYSSPAASPRSPGPSTTSARPSTTTWAGRGMPVATTSGRAGPAAGPGTWAPATESRPRASPSAIQRGSRLTGPERPRPAAGSPRRTTQGLHELRVDSPDLLLTPLDRRLEVHLVRAELRGRVDHHELLVDLVGGRRQRPGVADRHVVLRRLLEDLQLGVLADDRQRTLGELLEERVVVAGGGPEGLLEVVGEGLQVCLGDVLVLGELRDAVGQTVGEGQPGHRPLRRERDADLVRQRLVLLLDRPVRADRI